jgi:diketogulonate reductase-like aldo/keto reductase
MNNKCVTVLWLPAKEPSIAIWTTVQFSPFRHMGLPCFPLSIPRDIGQLRGASSRSIANAVGAVAAKRGVSRAQIALAWLRRNPVVVAPIVGASKVSHIDDAVAALSIALSDDEAAQLEAFYTPRYDTQGVSDPRELARIAATIGIKPTTA